MLSLAYMSEYSHIKNMFVINIKCMLYASTELGTKYGEIMEKG